MKRICKKMGDLPKLIYLFVYLSLLMVLSQYFVHKRKYIKLYYVYSFNIEVVDYCWFITRSQNKLYLSEIHYLYIPSLRGFLDLWPKMKYDGTALLRVVQFLRNKKKNYLEFTGISIPYKVWLMCRSKV